MVVKERLLDFGDHKNLGFAFSPEYRSFVKGKMSVSGQQPIHPATLGIGFFFIT
jgi:hypothetical protein